MGIDFNTEQVECIYKAENWWHGSGDQVFEISGAAGTGKTTIVRYLTERLNLDANEVLYVAFMGKAATCLARNGLPAATIHSTIYHYEKEPYVDENGNYVYLSNGKLKMKLTQTLKPKLNKHIKLIVLDEAGMVGETLAKDLLSFGIPVIALGDLNQLPPVMDKSFFLKNPDIVLTKIMRQSEGNPIIYLSQKVLNNEPLNIGVYGNSAVILKNNIDDHIFKAADMIITGTNGLRAMVNDLFRQEYKSFKNLKIPHIGEKIICRRNNWDKCICDGIFLTNGLMGFVDNVDMSSLKGNKLNIDFRPDFLEKPFKNLPVDYNILFSPPGSKDTQPYTYGANIFEFAYAITTHLSQGSQWDNVLLLAEKCGFDKEYNKKLLYTGITRAKDRITIAI